MVPFVDYGMWLSDQGTLSLNLLVGLVAPEQRKWNRATRSYGGGENDVGLRTEVKALGTRDDNRPDVDEGLAMSATYSGTAEGLSARETDGTTASGHFKADVSLTAKFGADATLEGRIDNFRSADPAGQGTAHVNSDWSADLASSPLTADIDIGDVDNNPNTPDAVTGGKVTGGTVSGPDGTSGEWAGIAYGKQGKRPDGFYGGFRLKFGDGDAAFEEMASQLSTGPQVLISRPRVRGDGHAARRI